MSFFKDDFFEFSSLAASKTKLVVLLTSKSQANFNLEFESFEVTRVEKDRNHIFFVPGNLEAKLKPHRFV